MKKIYVLILTLSLATVSAQTTVDFTTAEGYVQGPLSDNENWGGSNWFVNTTSGDEKISTTSGYSWAHWGQKFVMSVGDEMTFRLEFKFTGDPVQAGKKKARVGFNTGGVDKYTIEMLYISTLNDGSLYVRNPNNVDLTTGVSSLTDFQSDNLAIDVVIKIGADAASSSYTARFSNLSDNVTASTGEIVGIKQTIYDKAITTGISGIFQSQEFTGTQYFTVTKLIMTQGNTLSSERFNKLNFNLSQNPVQNELGITGLDTGSQISIYSISGAKVLSQEFNGNSINVSNLNAGLYFLEIPGYSVKKFLKK
jgi:hypothetical protein